MTAIEWTKEALSQIEKIIEYCDGFINKEVAKEVAGYLRTEVTTRLNQAIAELAKQPDLEAENKRQLQVIGEVAIKRDKFKAENEQLKYDLAIVHEHTNLADSNTKETFTSANKMIRSRTEKYANLELTAGPISGECPPKIAKRIKQALKGDKDD